MALSDGAAKRLEAAKVRFSRGNSAGYDAGAVAGNVSQSLSGAAQASNASRDTRAEHLRDDSSQGRRAHAEDRYGSGHRCLRIPNCGYEQRPGEEGKG